MTNGLPPRPPDPPRRSTWGWWLFGGIVGVLIAVAVLVVGPKIWRVFNPASASSSAVDSSVSPATRRIQATLFYISPDGAGLVPVSREVPYGATPTEQVKRLVEVQVLPPPAGLQSAIPNGTTVGAVFLSSDRKAYVDLGGTIVTGHTGGSLDEALCVYAIVNAVTTNLPEVSAVQILVNGKQVDTLVGHIDLRYPLTPAPEWIRKGP